MFIFNMSMIYPINYINTYKSQYINNASPSKISFKGNNDVAEFRKRMEEEVRTNNANSKSIYESIEKGNFKEAAKKTDDFGFDFNPNWSTQFGVPLLASIYNLPNLSARLKGKFTNKYKSEIITRIVTHPEFQPDRIFYINNKKGEEIEKTYVDIAVENDDIFLLQMLSAYGATLDKYSDKELSDLEMKAQKNKTILYALMTQFCDGTAKDAQIKSLQDEVRYLKKKLKKTSSHAPTAAADSGKGKGKLKGLDDIKVNIPSSIPSTLNNLGGMTEAKKAIEKFIIKPWSSNTMSLLKDNNIDMPNGFLMYGPPGCGKTYIAKVIAKQTGFPLYEVELGAIGDSYAYTVNNTLNKIFTQLEAQYKKTGKPSILFLDEIDSVAASRKLSQSDWKRDEINTLIALLNNSSEKGIIVIGATNFIDNVDEAVLRPGRFDKKIEIPLPDKAERKDILQKLIMNKKITSNLLPALDELANITDGKSCSDISAALNICGRNAIYEGKIEVTSDDFKNALQEIEYEANKRKRVIGFSA